MKKVLLGTTALVAAGAFAGIGAAQAQDMMVGMQPLELGGYYTLAGISTDTDGVDNRGHGIQQNIELEGRAIDGAGQRHHRRRQDPDQRQQRWPHARSRRRAAGCRTCS